MADFKRKISNSHSFSFTKETQETKEIGYQTFHHERNRMILFKQKEEGDIQPRPMSCSEIFEEQMEQVNKLERFICK